MLSVIVSLVSGHHILTKSHWLTSFQLEHGFVQRNIILIILQPHKDIGTKQQLNGVWSYSQIWMKTPKPIET